MSCYDNWQAIVILTRGRRTGREAISLEEAKRGGV